MATNNQKPTHPQTNKTNSNSTESIDQSCPICFELYDTDTHSKRFTICGHTFCDVCLPQLIKLKPFCPLCRQYLLQGDSTIEPKQLDNEVLWNPQVVRTMFGEEELDEKGNRFRRVCLSNGERTNIHVGRGCKINVSNDVNLVINGKRVQNPSDCSTQ